MKNPEPVQISAHYCPCGKDHVNPVSQVRIESGAVKYVVPELSALGAKKVFVLSDRSTFCAAGKTVCGLLDASGISYINYILDEERPEPDEKTVGSVLMHYDSTCNVLIGVGSGVINDIGKILSGVAGIPYIIVATAPSMDGYASSTSSMIRDNLKVSIPSKCPDVIIGDTEILRQAPARMLTAGLGDMLAKYVSICEWRISNLINGEYYCEKVAALVRSALKSCTDHADGLLNREPEAVEAVFKGLVTGGIAMTYAGLSRPASGSEHFFSHLWDMRSVEFKTPADLHGIQCALATLIVIRMYEKLRRLSPDKAHALSHAASFDYPAHCVKLRSFLGKSAESMISLEAKEGKYDPKKHVVRLEIILQNWDKIMDIIDEELPSSAFTEALLKKIGAPVTPEEIGLENSIIDPTFRMTADIRDKYVLSRLAWDLGVQDTLI